MIDNLGRHFIPIAPTVEFLFVNSRFPVYYRLFYI